MALAAMLWVPIAVRKNEHIILTYSLVNFCFTHPLTDAAGPFVARRLGGGAAHLGSFKYELYSSSDRSEVINRSVVVSGS